MQALTLDSAGRGGESGVRPDEARGLWFQTKTIRNQHESDKQRPPIRNSVFICLNIFILYMEEHTSHFKELIADPSTQV